ncbi:hypothetical protein HMH01_06030 [Halovulum dunhuangense]|uniref:Uncharacterized protein n=1 Tax=Halovulum dunhuangense TaxID=1505036 RepID=A0A849L172_9RHOB|nr:hypothetical protein [Halovulum dunhuangense]NNU79995.1 hypothetical protein [Halovulum dunhuangense]
MSSPLQNRVLPDGDIVAHPMRGTMMGNRGGRLHDAARGLGARRWVSRRWIICTLSFKDRHRNVMGAGYTELFFLDEVTALAAGHRPCFECRRKAARAFARSFPGADSADAIDRVLHAKRLGPRPRVSPGDLPDGAMVRSGQRMLAILGGMAMEWTPEGYGPAEELPSGPCALLTPAASVAVLRTGYAPAWHPSAPRPSGHHPLPHP